MSRILLPVTALLLAWPLSLFAQESRPKAVQKVYGVAELVVPLDAYKECGEEESSLPCCPQPGAALLPSPLNTCEDKLIKLITGTVRPHCWAQAGGPCTINYFPLGMALAIDAPDDVQKEVAGLLDKLRRQQEASIAVTLRLVTVSETFAERFGVEFGCGECCEAGSQPPARTVRLTKGQLWLFLKAAQDDRHFCVTQAPLVNMMNGQAATISMQDSQKYVTGVNIRMVDGQQRVVPETTARATGLYATMKGTISADGKSVALHLDATHTALADDQVPLLPVTYTVSPVLADGSQGKPVPVTQLIQQPKFNTMKVDTRLNIPVGETVLIDAGKFLRVEREERGAPVFSRIPYLNRLFKNVGCAATCQQMFVLVTPEIKNGEAQEASCPACPHCAPPSAAAAKSCAGDRSCGGMKQASAAVKSALEARVAGVAAKLVAKYHEACARGEHEQAREFAQMALDLDPACFSKPFAVAVRPASEPLTPVAPPCCSEPTPMSSSVLRAIHEQMDQRLPARFAAPPQPTFGPVAPPQSRADEPQRPRLMRRIVERLTNSWAAGMTLPSPYYLEHRPQSFRPDAESPATPPAPPKLMPEPVVPTTPQPEEQTQRVWQRMLERADAEPRPIMYGSIMHRSFPEPTTRSAEFVLEVPSRRIWRHTVVAADSPKLGKDELKWMNYFAESRSQCFSSDAGEPTTPMQDQRIAEQPAEHQNDRFPGELDISGREPQPVVPLPIYKAQPEDGGFYLVPGFVLVRLSRDGKPVEPVANGNQAPNSGSAPSEPRR